MIAGGRWGHKPKNKTLTNTHALTHHTKHENWKFFPLFCNPAYASPNGLAQHVSYRAQRSSPSARPVQRFSTKCASVLWRNAQEARARVRATTIHGNAPHVSHTLSPADSSPGWTGGFSGGASLRFGGDFSRTLPR